MNLNILTERIKTNISDFFNLDLWVKNVKEHAPHVSAETMGWIAGILMHLATIPTMVAVLTGLTEKMPPVDLVLFVWAGLVLLFGRAIVLKDTLNIVTIGVGFITQAVIMAVILFK